MQKGKMSLAKLLLFLVVVLILFPLPFDHYLKYSLGGGYLVVGLTFLFLPTLFFRVPSYWRSKTTKAVWGLRYIVITIFLLATFRLGINRLDLVACVGTLALTFFYETGCLIVASGYFSTFLRYWVMVCTIIIGYSYIIILPIVLHNGLRSLIYFSTTIRQYIPDWPNYYAIMLTSALWVSVWLVFAESKKYLLPMLLILPILFVSGSRTALLALLGGAIIAVWRNIRKIKLVMLVSSVLLLALALPFFFSLKEATHGATLSYTIESRMARWHLVYRTWLDYPAIGYGFRSFTEILPTFDWGNVTTKRMGSSHNDYFDTLLRGGMLYSLYFWVFVLLLIRQGFRLQRHGREFFEYLSYAVVGFLVAAVFQNPFKHPIMLAYFWIYTAAISFYEQEERPRVSVRGG